MNKSPSSFNLNQNIAWDKLHRKNTYNCADTLPNSKFTLICLLLFRRHFSDCGVL